MELELIGVILFVFIVVGYLSRNNILKTHNIIALSLCYIVV